MARLGDKSSNKETDSGKKYFGDKTVDFLKQKSRNSLEEDQDFSILYFQVDWINSKRNFYGEMLIKKFVNPLGIQIKGQPKITQGDEEMNEGIPSQIMKMTFSCYTDQLKELNIEPQLDDYFSYGQRIYSIYKKTMKDFGPGNVLGNRDRMRIDYYAIQADDEILQISPFEKNIGLDIQIRGNGSIENL